MTDLEKYYNKFNEEKRLTTRQGQVEFLTSMKYIHDCIDIIRTKDNKCSALQGNNFICDTSADTNIGSGGYYGNNSDISIIDIGAGTGRYSVALSDEGYDVTAVELVAYNLGILKAKNSSVKAYKGNALNLKKFADNSFDMALLFGPMYHLHNYNDKVKALSEAVRVTKRGGYVLVAYCMNEYSVLTYAFKDRHIRESMKKGFLDDTFKVLAGGNDLYDVMRIEDINCVNESYNKICFEFDTDIQDNIQNNNQGNELNNAIPNNKHNNEKSLKRVERYKIIAADGAATYMREMIRSLDEEEFQLFLDYHFATCEREDLLGASWHTVDILKVV